MIAQPDDTALTVRTRSAASIGGARGQDGVDRRTLAADDADTANVAPPDENGDDFELLANKLRHIDNTDINKGNTEFSPQSEFKQAQKTDETLADLWRKADLGVDYLAVKAGLLFKKIPAHILSVEEYALVLPDRYVNEVIEAAHTAPMGGGHFGRRKTEQKIAPLFYFPHMRQRISAYIRNCRNCQMVKPMRKCERQPLQKMDISPTHAFEDVTMDFLGSEFPMTKRRNKYMFVIIDNLTKWVHITPMKSLRSEAIADALIEYFSVVGIPRTLRSDNAPGFKSELMRALCDKLGINPKFSVPFHFASHGSVERVQGTIEMILRKFVQTNASDWDVLLPYILFSLREVPHSSTGYSPAQLVFGRKLRGLLHVMRENWTDGDELMDYKNISTAEYVAKLSKNIESTLQLARENMAEAEAKMKQTYDKTSSIRQLKPGDLALVLMPTSRNKIFSVWKGPYKVIKRRENNNYELLIGNRTAILHINSLRRYYESDQENNGQKLSLMVVDDSDEQESQVIEGETCGSETAETDGHTSKTDGANNKFTISQQLTDEQSTEFQKMLAEFPEVFCGKPGKTNIITHRIRVRDETPSYQPPYRIPEILRDPVESELMSMLEHGIIQRDDESSWSSPLIVLRKPGGGLRLVNNFIQLNEKTISEPYMMTNLNELLSRAAGSQFITRIDMQKMFFQIGLHPDSRKYTGFETHVGKFVYASMPQGLKNATATCQKAMNFILRGLHRFAGSLLDDVVVFDHDFDLHLGHVRQVLERLRDAGLTANVGKCIFAENRLKILGHLLENGKIYPDPDKIKAVAEMQTPRTKSQLKSVLGFFGYFRDYVPHYAEIAFPLSELTAKSKPQKLNWTSEQQNAFDKLRSTLTSKPVLRPPDMSKDFQLYVDSSKISVSAILMQKEDANEDEIGHVICYGSRKLLPRERKYPIVELELLALVYGVLRYKHYIYGKKVDVFSDHQPIKWMNSLVKHNCRIARWALLIQDFDLTIHHVPGTHQLADVLTRLDD